MSTDKAQNRRILIVDDNEDIHHDFRRILEAGASTWDVSDLDDLETVILGTAPAPSRALAFELTSAFQGAEALAKVRKGLADGAPYALAFIDVRMPPGWDGVETLDRIWREDPHLHAVICSAYSDYAWEGLQSRLGQTDRLFLLKKPFDTNEVRQLASALVERWNHVNASQRTEQALRRSEADLHKLFSAHPDAALRVASDGTCLAFKPSRDVPPALQPAFPPGRRLDEALPADVAQRMLAHLSQVLGDGTTHVMEYGQSLGGEARFIEARISAIDAGEALVLLRDITDRRRHEERT
jgi:CheY-like chemotaxis protein